MIHCRDKAKLQHVVKELKAASGNDEIQKYFNVKTEARADPQAYDPPARKRLRELSLRLTA